MKEKMLLHGNMKRSSPPHPRKKSSVLVIHPLKLKAEVTVLPAM